MLRLGGILVMAYIVMAYIVVVNSYGHPSWSVVRLGGILVISCGMLVIV